MENKTQENEVILKVRNLQKHFSVGRQDVRVLKGLDFEIRNRDMVIIYGPSGCGKSTLLNTIIGLETPSEGEVFFFGEDLYRNNDEDGRTDFRKKRIGMVYQQPNWVGSLNVVENVALPLLFFGMDRMKAIEVAHGALNYMQMDDWALYKPTELSSGQQQKVAVARAIITNPDVIVADEPTGNLDYESGKNLMHILGDLNHIGKTVIVVTHDLEYIQYAKTTIQMLDGKIVEFCSDTEKLCKINSGLKPRYKKKKKAKNEEQKNEE